MLSAIIALSSTSIDFTNPVQKQRVTTVAQNFVNDDVALISKTYGSSISNLSVQVDGQNERTSYSGAFKTSKWIYPFDGSTETFFVIETVILFTWEHHWFNGDWISSEKVDNENSRVYFLYNGIETLRNLEDYGITITKRSIEPEKTGIFDSDGDWALFRMEVTKKGITRIYQSVWKCVPIAPDYIPFENIEINQDFMW